MISLFTQLRRRLLAPTILAASLVACDQQPAGQRQGGSTATPRASAPSAFVAARPEDLPNVVLIVVDTLRADHLGCYGYYRDTTPNIDAFASEALLFERAYAPMATTLPSHVSMFTGLYPLEHGTLANVRHGGKAFGWNPNITSVAELFQRNGFRTAGFVAATPLKRVVGFGVGFDVYEEPLPHRIRAGEVNAKVLPWLRANASQRFFLFVHYYDPHNMPYMSGPPYSTMYETDERQQAWMSERRMPAEVAQSACRPFTRTAETINRYDGEIRYVNDELQRVLTELRDLGLYEKSVIIIASDHGEGLNQHDWPAHGRVWNEQLHVPLLVRFPRPLHDGLPQRFDGLVSLLDLFPTVLTRIRAPFQPEFMKQSTGVDVLAEDYRPRPLLGQRSGRDCGEDSGPEFALVTPEWSYLWDDAIAADLLFARASDPHELTNVASGHTSTRDSLRSGALALVELLRARGAAFEQGQAGGAAELDPRVLRELEAMGYITGAAPTSQPEHP